MSNTMKILVALVVLIGGGGAAAYFGKLGPFQDTAVTPVAAPAGTGAATPCPDAGASTGAPGAGAGAGAGATDPATGAPAAGSGTGTATDPATGAAVTGAGSSAAPSDSTTIVASGTRDAGEGYATDSPIYAATPAPGATDPSTGAPVPDPAAGGATATDPATGAPVPDPAAGGATATDPATGAVVPCTTTDPALGGATPGGGVGATGAAAGAGAAAASAAGIVALGTSSGNNDAALAVANSVATIASKNKFVFQVEATLIPVAGGVAVAKNKLGAYRRSVTSASLRLKIGDDASMQSWTSSKKPSKTKYVQTLLKLLGKNYPNGVRSVTVVSSADKVIAVGDAGKGGALRIRILG